MKILIICLAAILLTDCADTTISPNGENVFTSVSASSNQAYAERKAREHCNKLGKQLVILKHETKYRDTTAAMKIAGAFVSGLSDKPASAVTDNDYAVTMRFKCTD